MAVNKQKMKKAKELAKEIFRCEMVLQNEESSDLEKKQATTKILMISKAYENDFEMLILLDSEIQKMLTK